MLCYKSDFDKQTSVVGKILENGLYQQKGYPSFTYNRDGMREIIINNDLLFMLINKTKINAMEAIRQKRLK